MEIFYKHLICYFEILLIVLFVPENVLKHHLTLEKRFTTFQTRTTLYTGLNVLCDTKSLSEKQKFTMWHSTEEREITIPFPGAYEEGTTQYLLLKEKLFVLTQRGVSADWMCSTAPCICSLHHEIGWHVTFKGILFSTMLSNIFLLLTNLKTVHVKYILQIRMANFIEIGQSYDDNQIILIKYAEVCLGF